MQVMHNGAKHMQEFVQNIHSAGVDEEAEYHLDQSAAFSGLAEDAIEGILMLQASGVDICSMSDVRQMLCTCEDLLQALIL